MSVMVLKKALTCRHSMPTGVIWRGDSLIEGVSESIDFLRSLVRLPVCAAVTCKTVSSPQVIQHASTCKGCHAGPCTAAAQRTSRSLCAQGKKLYFVTNNSTKSREGYLGKFTKLGLKISAEEIYSSSYAAAAYLESIDFPKDKKVNGKPDTQCNQHVMSH